MALTAVFKVWLFWVYYEEAFTQARRGYAATKISRAKSAKAAKKK